MNTLTRGIRNAFRNNIRTFSIVIILGLSIALALAMVVARQAVQSKIDSVKSSIGNMITVSPAGARGFEGGGEPLTTNQMKQIQALPHVVAVTETIQDRLDSSQTNLKSAIDAGSLGQRFANRGFGGGGFGGQGENNGTFVLPVSVIGTNNTRTLQAFGGGGTIKLTSGQTFDPTQDKNVALIGTDLATKNDLRTGSTFQAYGTIVTVNGIFDAGNRFSNGIVVMPLPAVQRLSGQANDISSAVVQVDSITNLNNTDTAIKNALGSMADVVSQQDTSAEALQPLENIKKVSLYSVIGAMVAGAVIILLTMVMIVRERRREIGVLKAIGASNLRVMLQFMSEAVTLTVLGLIIGLLLGVAGANPLTKALVNSSNNAAINQPPAGAVGAGFRRFGGGGGVFFNRLNGGSVNLRNIHAVVGWNVLVYGLLAALGIAIVGSAAASMIISKIRPAEVMRAE